MLNLKNKDIRIANITSVNEKKIGKILDKVLDMINKSKLTIPELIILIGNLSYFIGASIAGFVEKGPSIDDLKKEYYRNPTIDIALMLQGLEITTWEEDFLKSPKISNIANMEDINIKEE